MILRTGRRGPRKRERYGRLIIDNGLVTLVLFGCHAVFRVPLRSADGRKLAGTTLSTRRRARSYKSSRVPARESHPPSFLHALSLALTVSLFPYFLFSSTPTARMHLLSLLLVAVLPVSSLARMHITRNPRIHSSRHSNVTGSTKFKLQDKFQGQTFFE